MLADRVLRTHQAKLVGINAGVCSRDWNLNIAILKFGFETSDFENWKFKLENWKLKTLELKTGNWILVGEHCAWAPHLSTAPEHRAWAPRPSTRLSTVLGPLALFSARRSDFPYLSHCMLADGVLRTHKAKLVGINAGVCSRDWNLKIAILQFGFKTSDLKIESWDLKNENLKFQNWKLEI